MKENVTSEDGSEWSGQTDKVLGKAWNATDYEALPVCNPNSLQASTFPVSTRPCSFPSFEGTFCYP